MYHSLELMNNKDRKRTLYVFEKYYKLSQDKGYLNVYAAFNIQILNLIVRLWNVQDRGVLKLSCL